MAENDGTRDALKRAVRAAVYLPLGVVVTGGVALVLLNLLQPVQAAVYDAVYLQTGPSRRHERNWRARAGLMVGTVTCTRERPGQRCTTG